MSCNTPILSGDHAIVTVEIQFRGGRFTYSFQSIRIGAWLSETSKQIEQEIERQLTAA